MYSRMHQLFSSLLFTVGLDPEVKTLFMKDNVATQKVILIQWTPLNGITLGQTITDPIKQMITLTEYAVVQVYH